jgi:Uma2 family endonuclease
MTAAEFARAAQEFLSHLLPEQFWEMTSQATQREITVESLALVKDQRPDVHYFNELLVQYLRRGNPKLGQIVPDNMVVLSQQPLHVEGSFDVNLQPVRPFWVFEYASKRSPRKNYDENAFRYEKELKVPYFLLFYPETRDLTLYRHTGRKHVPLQPDAHGRHLISELELEVGLRDGWVRYWFRGELLPLPADLQRDLDEARRRADRLQAQLDLERQARKAVERELQRLQAQLKQMEPLQPQAGKKRSRS